MTTESENYGERFNAEVAADLRAARSRQRKSFPEIADTTGIPRNTLLRYFNGQRDIPMPAFGRIARALNLPVGETLDAIAQRLEQD
ncbi:transcriptional regulator with XRE-family HTH domain [Microbacterium marinum]|uniref:Transcriptional regulator with XRE-family HTH domain n=1 Tax=Microbacterium marinum TaxID=421115 RepID=A0A7W7BQG5_9MICO|nr:helix-turn-helix transcriptional regulator [Microbacterium marinum]MBB4666942.1 transcriptional regulator with XRE-family HTH domain [Microbacterium marinum]